MSTFLQPKVSVVVASYNAEPFIAQTVESILANGRPELPIELIVVDDCSRDGTRDVLARFGDAIRVIANDSNQGPCRSRNTGIAHARAPLIALCDHDDLWEPDKLTLQLPAFDDAGIGLVCTASEAFSADARFRLSDSFSPISKDGRVFRQLLDSNFIVCSSVVVRKAVLDEVGGFDPAIFPGEDIDLWLRVSQTWRVAKIERVLTHHRVSPTQFSHNKVRMKNARKAVLEKYGALLDDPREFGRIMGGIEHAMGLDHWCAEEYAAARAHFAEAMRRRGVSASSGLLWAMTFIPPGLRRSVRRIRGLLKPLRAG